ncbi:MAG: rhomboid family intramembrane serine protease [Bacteroidales bacterium]|nr:rhomboid family intramembrane serine protease [Bacteroidales bacterium]
MLEDKVKEERNRLLRSFIIPTAFVVIIWLVKCVEELFLLDFSYLGVKPLQPDGIPGIFLFHFLHGSWSHLLANTLPIIVLGFCLYYFYKPIATKIWLLLMFSTGLLTWCGARGGVHVGASAMIYGLAFFLMMSGFIRRNKNLVIVSFLVIFLYGSLIWGIYPKYAIDNNISWEGHLAGLIMGIILAVFYKNEGPQRENPSDDEDDDNDLSDDDRYWDVPEPPKEELTQPRYFRH